MKEYLQIWKFIFTCLVLSFFIGCASTGSPNGGPKDNKPPALVKEKSDKNFSTNFVPNKLELVFDEWIELKNQQREILISPPFFKTPKISSRGKKITIEFPEEEPLREDATYIINFGKSIVDFTEGNAAEGFKFVFATGDVIDSLELSGSIVEAMGEKPVKDILVLLYDVLGDSVVISEKPFYYARTDDSGGFKFENLKNDTFKLLVLEDLNFNYLLDPELERLAFPDSLLILNDSSTYNPELRLFKPEQSLRILNSSSQTPGVITTEFNKSTEEIDFNFIYPSDFDPLVERSKDTLLLWFTEVRDSVGIAYGTDTLDFTIKAFDSVFYNKQLAFTKYNAAKTTLAPFDSLDVTFTSPLSRIDTSLIRLTNQPVTININPTVNGMKGLAKDSTQIKRGKKLLKSTEIDTLEAKIDTTVVDSSAINVVTDTTILIETNDTIPNDTIPKDTIVNDVIVIDTTTSIVDTVGVDSLTVTLDTALIDHALTFSFRMRQLYINSKWIEKYGYRLELLPGAITDIYGRQNDTLVLDFKTAGFDEYGNISINLSGLDSAQKYVVLLKLKDETIKKTIVPDTSVSKIVHKRLRVNTYSIELIKDDDGNGKWTTGDYWLKRQPEELKTFTLEKLRENWDLEANVFWNESKSIMKDSTGMVRDSTTLNLPPPGVKKKVAPNRSGNPRGRPGNGRDPKGKND